MDSIRGVALEQEKPVCDAWKLQYSYVEPSGQGNFRCDFSISLIVTEVLRFLYSTQPYLVCSKVDLN